MLAAGRTTPEIAGRLHISHLTARNHIQNILDKLELHSKAEAVAFAFQKGIVGLARSSEDSPAKSVRAKDGAA